jgi:hypothetical protein
VLTRVLSPAGSVVAENRRERVCACAPAQVDVVDPDSLDSDEQLALPRLRVGHLLEPKHLRPAGLVHDNRTHDETIYPIAGLNQQTDDWGGSRRFESVGEL